MWWVSRRSAEDVLDVTFFDTFLGCVGRHGGLPWMSWMSWMSLSSILFLDVLGVAEVCRGCLGCHFLRCFSWMCWVSVRCAEDVLGVLGGLRGCFWLRTTQLCDSRLRDSNWRTLNMGKIQIEPPHIQTFESERLHIAILLAPTSQIPDRERHDSIMGDSRLTDSRLSESTLGRQNISVSQPNWDIPH